MMCYLTQVYDMLKFAMSHGCDETSCDANVQLHISDIVQ
jgi:hypothetical protein